MSNPGTCPRCKRYVQLRADGTVGLHYTNRRLRVRCPEGLDPRAPAGRRVTVTLQVVIPATMSDHAYRHAAAALLRTHAGDAFLVDIDVQPHGGSS